MAVINIKNKEDVNIIFKFINSLPYIKQQLKRIEELEASVEEKEAIIVELENEVESLNSEINELRELTEVNEVYPEEVIEEEVAVPIMEHELKVYSQKSANTVRYYYKSTYLFSAPEKYLEELQVELNRLLNLRPELTLTELKEELRLYKVMLQQEEELLTKPSEATGLSILFG